MNAHDPDLDRRRRQSELARRSSYITGLCPGSIAARVALLALRKYVTGPKKPGTKRVDSAFEAARIELRLASTPATAHAYECFRLALREVYEQSLQPE